VLLAEALIVSGAVRHAFISGRGLPAGLRAAIIAFSSYPLLVYRSFETIKAEITSDPGPLLIPAHDAPSWRKGEKKPDGTENGYLLFSGLSPSAKQAVIQLIRLSDDHVVWSWKPDFKRINESRSTSKYVWDDTRVTSLAVAPLLRKDGSIIFNTSGGRLVKLNICGDISWVLTGPFHHSIEEDADEKIWVPAVHENTFPDNPLLNQNLRDDALALLTTNGQILRVHSFSQILINNGLRALLFGQFDQTLYDDPIHLNDIQPAIADGDFWKKGDLLISARNLSSIFLFRPSTNTILWYKTGPWIHQHDANFIDSHRISVFGNDALLFGNYVSKGLPLDVFLNEGKTNEFYVYDFRTNSVVAPFTSLLAENDVRTITQGRANIGDDNSLFIEETDHGRLLRFLNGRLLWSRINWYDKNRVGSLSWSRYESPADVDQFIKLTTETRCVPKR
jgi:hypothetical protein